MHAILAVDTGDDNIGESVAQDLEVVGSALEVVAKVTGLALKRHVYESGDFTVENVKSAVEDVRPRPDDVLIFYYSGHGYRTPSKQSRWPYLQFPSDHALDFGEIADALLEKGARMTVSLVDACNNVLDVRLRAERLGEGKVSEARGIRALFLQSKGYVTAASSIPGEPSYGTRDGGLFTQSWIDALATEAGRGDPSWHSMMRNAAGRRLSAGNDSQQPFFEMDVIRMGGAATASAGASGVHAPRSATPIPPPSQQRPGSQAITF